MKTLEQILTYDYKNGCLDGRDITRLSVYIPYEYWSKLGLKLKPGKDPSEVITLDLTEENILKNLEHDLAFAFDKALDQRGISSSLMFDVIKMWLWILDDELCECNEYAMYGLPLYKKVAVKYNFNNPIGDDYGNEIHYDSDSYTYFV